MLSVNIFITQQEPASAPLQEWRRSDVLQIIGKQVFPSHLFEADFSTFHLHSLLFGSSF